VAKHVKSSARPSIPDAPLRATTRGNQTPSLPTIVAVTFSRLNLRMRARMLGRLLASVGSARADGDRRRRLRQIRDACAAAGDSRSRSTTQARATSSQIYEIVRYVEQSNPHLYSQLLNLLARDSTTIAALGASIAALTLNRLASRPTYSATAPRHWRPVRRKPGGMLYK
jgi:hypothetical protein